MAHLWAPRFGDEAAAGIMWAPKQMNQDFQNHKVEPWIERLRDNAPPRSIEITASAISWDNNVLKERYNWTDMKGAEFLKKVTYEVSDCPRGFLDPASGIRVFRSFISMTLGAPTPANIPKVEKIEVGVLMGGSTTINL